MDVVDLTALVPGYHGYCGYCSPAWIEIETVFSGDRSWPHSSRSRQASPEQDFRSAFKSLILGHLHETRQARDISWHRVFTVICHRIWSGPGAFGIKSEARAHRDPAA